MFLKYLRYNLLSEYFISNRCEYWGIIGGIGGIGVMNVGWLVYNYNVLGICVLCRSGKFVKLKFFNYWRISLKFR